MEKPTLRFNSATSQSGFTNASTSASNDKNASVIIREILQNSFDSAIIEAEQETANVKFSLEYVKKDDIPGIEEYEKSISYIKKLDLSKNEQEKDILNVIEEELNKDSLPVLFITDNGIGFDPKKMVAILSDGISDKSDPKNSGGSYGNGHYSAFNISNLRYVMYGAKLKDTSIICSGQALLRTHKDEKNNLKLGTGFYVTNDKPIEVESKNFPKNENVPSFMKNKLEKITDKSGAVIAIIGFNFFGKKHNDTELINLISAAVVRNFFVALKENQLTVEIVADSKLTSIDSDNIDEIFKKTKEIKAEPSYKSLEKFYNTFINGQAEIITTTQGKVKVHYKESDSTSLAICRNGMWICDSLPPPLNQGNFTDVKFFNALVIPQKSTNLSALVRRSEGNLHNDLRLNRFTDDKDGKKKKDDLKNSLQEISDFLKKVIGKNDNTTFTISIPDLSIEMISDKQVNTPETQNKKSNKSKKTKKIPKPTINSFGENENEAHGDKKKKNKKDTDSPEKRRAGNPFSVKKFLSSHDGDNKTAHVKFNTGKKATNLLLCMRIDDGTDPSCDNTLIPPRLKIKKAILNEKELEIIDEDTIDFGVVEKTDVIDLSIHYDTEIEGHYTIHYEFLNSLLKKDKND